MEEEETPPLELSKCLKDRVPALPSLVSALTCNICYDPFENPVLTGCSHTFCSLCIRKYLVYKQQCPQCGTLTTDGQLRSNKAAGESAVLLRDLVSSVERLLSSAPVSATVKPAPLERRRHTESPITPVQSANLETRPAKFNQPGRRPSQTSSSQNDSDNENVPLSQQIDEVQSQSSQAVKVLVTNPSTLPSKPSSFVSGLSLLHSPKREKQVLSNINENISSPGPNTKVECMICKVFVANKNLPLHLNTCLEKQPPSGKPLVKRKPLPKLVYNLLKDSELKKRCKEVGLSTKGDRRALIGRHQKFSVLYNSECELENPRSKSELVRQVEREENAEKSGTSANSLLRFDRNCDAKSIEEKQKKYIQQNKSSFSHLISSVKQKEKIRLEISEKKPVINNCQQEILVIEDSQEPSTSEQKKNLAGASEEALKLSSRNTSRKPSLESTDEESDSKATERIDDRKQTSSKAGGSKSIGIKESLARSVERNKSVEKQTCPVCQTQVVERYLNIHLDKCLRKNEPDPSPILKKSTQTSKSTNRTKSVKRRKICEDSSDTEDDLRPWDSPPPKKKSKQKAVVLSDDEFEDVLHGEDNLDDGEAEVAKDSSVLVAEPSLTDLINMGLGSRGKEGDLSEDLDSSQDGISLSNGLDQYTDNLSQESYSQGSDDMFAAFDMEDGDESIWEDDAEMDVTLNNHIDKLTDQYLGESPSDKKAGKLFIDNVLESSMNLAAGKSASGSVPGESDKVGRLTVDEGRMTRKRGSSTVEKTNPGTGAERRSTRRKL